MKLIKYLFLGFLAVSLVSCDDYLDVNTDPNNPTEVSPALILPVGQNYTAVYISGSRRANHLSNMLMYNWGEAFGFSWYGEEFRYSVSTTFYEGLFDYAYQNPMKQYKLLEDLEGEENANYKAIGTIMNAFHFQYLVDIYGDVPYVEALGRSQNSTPVYDDAQTIYDSLSANLLRAVDLIESVEGSALAVIPGDDDAMFGGDMLLWKQFANSLHARILVRESDIAANDTKIANAFDAIAANGAGYINQSVAIDPGYVAEENKQNPFWASFGTNVDGSLTQNYRATSATQFVLDYLSSTGDPRINTLYEEPADGHQGINQGVDQTSDQTYEFVSSIGPGLRKGPDQGSIIMTNAENNLNLAEAALKGYNVGGTAQEYYEAGVQASFTQLGNGSASGYLTLNQQNVNWNASADKLEAIITQKWIATNGTTASQSWFDYNRTGFPRNLPVSTVATSTDRPVRLFYPSSERNTNAVNTPAQPNAFTDKIFWAN